MTFDLVDIVTFTCIIELIFFIIFVQIKSSGQYHNKMLICFFTFQMLGIAGGMLRKYNLCYELRNFLIAFELLWAPSLFLYAQALTKTRVKAGLYLIYHAAPFILLFAYNILKFSFQLPEAKIGIIVGIQVQIYNIAGLIILDRYRRKVKENYSKDEFLTRKWVTVVLVGYALAAAAPLIAKNIGFYQQSMLVKGLIDFVPFLIFYNILFFNAIGNPVVIYEIPTEEKYSGSSLKEELALEYLKKLDKTIETDKCYMEPELSLAALSNATGIPAKYLSQVINQYKHQSFYDYINGLRIKNACELISNNSKLTFLEVLYESGFNSKTSFNISFKKQTGLTPTQYKSKQKA